MIGSAAPPPPVSAARLVPLDPGSYAFSLTASPEASPEAAIGRRAAANGPALPAVHVGTLPHGAGDVAIVDGFGRAGGWLGDQHDRLFVTAPTAGGAALVTAYLAPDQAGAPLELEIRRVDRPAPVVTLSLGGAAAPAQDTGLEVLAHIRGRGDVRFVDAPWIGRLGPGLWIEAFTLRPRDPTAEAAIECKGLIATGGETAWLAAGVPCGSRGRGLPLIGFAVRQKAAAGGVLFDCEYTGYFASGATVGPARNGAPCRSAVDNDPLEGLQLRVVPRAT